MSEQEEAKLQQEESEEAKETKPRKKRKENNTSSTTDTSEMIFIGILILFLVLGSFRYDKEQKTYTGYLTQDVADTLYGDKRLEGEQLTDFLREQAQDMEYRSQQEKLLKSDIRIYSLLNRLLSGGDDK